MTCSNVRINCDTDILSTRYTFATNIYSFFALHQRSSFRKINLNVLDYITAGSMFDQ